MNSARFQQYATYQKFGKFDSKNISKDQMQSLRVDANSGYKEQIKYTGARPSIGRSASSTGTGKTDFSYYKNHPGWSAIAKEIGIKNINSHNDISQMYDYTNNYSSSKAAPAPAAPAYTPQQAALPVNNPYKAEADRLLKTIKEMETARSEEIAAAPKTIYAASQAVQPTDLTIASAGTTSKQTGTSSFKRAKKKTVTGNNLRTIQSVNI
jgi:hypothetical protein